MLKYRRSNPFLAKYTYFSNKRLAHILNISETNVVNKCNMIKNAFKVRGPMTNSELIEHILDNRHKENPNKWFNEMLSAFSIGKSIVWNRLNLYAYSTQVKSSDALLQALENETEGMLFWLRIRNMQNNGDVWRGDNQNFISSPILSISYSQSSRILYGDINIDGDAGYFVSLTMHSRLEFVRMAM